MKVFVSGRIDDSDKLREAFSLIESKGHTITHDWTKTDAFLSGKESKLNSIEESRKRAEADIQGVIDADVYILMSDNETAGKGMYVELGAALALAQSGSRDIRIYVVGPMNHMSLFYLHPLAKRFDTLEEVLGSIG